MELGGLEERVDDQARGLYAQHRAVRVVCCTTTPFVIVV